MKKVKTVRNIVIGTLITALLVTMFVLPAAAEITANLYVIPVEVGYTSADYVRDESGVKLVGDGSVPAGPDDLLQIIWDKSVDGITPPDPDDPSKCTNSVDDVIYDTFPVGEGDMGYGTFYDATWWPTSSEGGPFSNGTEMVYIRAWNAPTVGDATHYGDSIGVLVHQGTADYDMLPSGTWWTSEPKPGAAPPTFEKELVLGWNLVSLPLTPLNNSTSAVLGNDTMAYDVVYSYNAVSNSWDSVLDGKMDPGIGYFVNVTTAGTWNYTGTEAYDSMSIGLESGLNMVGWLNCSDKRINETTSLAGNSTYVARWNATSQSYEVYNPHAPEPETDMFNDFWMMDRGEGYFVAAKTAFTLSESC